MTITIRGKGVSITEKITDIYFGISGAAEVFIGYHYFGRLTGKNAFGKCAAAVIVLAVMQLCFGAVNSVIGMTSGFIIGKDPDITAAVMIILNMLSLGMVCACCEILIKKFASVCRDKIKNSAEFLLPVIMIFCTFLFLNHAFFGNTVSSYSIWKMTAKSHWIFALQALGIAAVFCIIRLRNSFILKNKEAECARLRTENAERLCEKTRAFRHDVKNHMLAVAGFLAEGNIDGAEKYLAEAEKIITETAGRFKTGNHLADIILSQKLSEAEKNGVKAFCDIKIPSCGISDTDLCVILANAVDNAVHACEKLEKNAEKFIEIRGRLQGNILLTEIKNSFDGGKFKKGVGLKNIETAVKKYCGNTKISCSENTFTLRIIMNISQH